MKTKKSTLSFTFSMKGRRAEIEEWIQCWSSGCRARGTTMPMYRRLSNAPTHHPKSNIQNINNKKNKPHKRIQKKNQHTNWVDRLEEDNGGDGGFKKLQHYPDQFTCRNKSRNELYPSYRESGRGDEGGRNSYSAGFRAFCDPLMAVGRSQQRRRRAGRDGN